MGILNCTTWLRQRFCFYKPIEGWWFFFPQEISMSPYSVTSMRANLCDKRKICLWLCIHKRERTHLKRDWCKNCVQMLHDCHPNRESDPVRGGKENENGRKKWSPDMAAWRSEAERTPRYVWAAKNPCSFSFLASPQANSKMNQRHWGGGNTSSQSWLEAQRAKGRDE